MAVGKELFKLYGLIGMQGVEKTQKQITGIDKQARKLQKEVDRLGRKVSDLGSVFTKAFTLPILAAATASIKFIDQASELNETISKVGEIFGSSAKDIEDWAKTSATKLGQSKVQAMDAASTFAIFGKSAGLAGKELVSFSTEFAELASDMASFFNTSPEEAITAIGAALRGENEPIRRYGVLLDDATMRQKAFELGLITSTNKALLPQTKVLAAQAVILEQTKTAQGDFARTSAGFANGQRILAAQFKNVSATLGQLFLPTALKVGQLLSKLVGFAERMIDAWNNLDASTKRTIKGFIVIVAALGPAVFLIGKLISLSSVLIPLITGLVAGTTSLSAAMAKLNKSTLLITVTIAALVALGWYWYSQWDTLSIQLQALWAKIVLFVKKGANVIVQNVGDMLINILGFVRNISSLVPGLEKKVSSAIQSILKFKAAMYGDLGKQQAYTNSINESAKANVSLADSVKKAISDGKKLLGVKDETIKKTQLEIDKEKEAAKASEELAKKRLQFNQDILDQLKRIGKDKFELLEIERQEAVKKAEELGADVARVDELFTARRLELKQEEINERIKFEEATAAELDNLRLTELEKLDAQRQAALEKANQLGADKYLVVELYAMREQELKDRLREEELAKDRQAIQEKLRMASNIGNKLNRVLSRFSDNKLKRIDLEEQREIAAIKNSSMTEEAKEVAIQRIQAQTEEKRRKAEKQRAIREKAMSLFNIAINTASAVVEALPNIPLSIIVGGLGLAEAAAVAAAPLPFFEGGFIKGSEKGVNAVVGEQGQDEIVFPLERGIGLLVDGLISKLASVELPSIAPQAASPALAGAGGDVRDVHLHIGTFIGDERGLKQLERKLDSIRIAENQRKGF